VFSVFAILGGVAVFGSIGTLALLPDVRWFFMLAAACLAIRAMWWHARRSWHFRLDRSLVQAHRGVAGHSWIGTAYFGWILGTTLFTQIVTPVIQALAATAAVLGVQFGIAAGVGLGIARSVDPWRGALTRTRPSPAIIVERYLNGRIRHNFRIGGILAAVVLLCLDVISKTR
jgi:hypothetical protein